MKAKFMPMAGAARRLRAAVRLLATTLVVGLPAVLPCAGAVQADRSQPLLVDAGAMHYDDAAQATVFTGGVVMTKGTLVLRAAKVEVHQRADGYDDATAFGSARKPATFNQTLDAPAGQPRPTVHGSALQLHYDGHSDLITLTGQALLERSVDGRLTDRAQGAVITYDDLRDVFTVRAGQAGANPSNPEGRVRVMLSPRAPLSAASAASAPPLRLRNAPAARQP